jgi:GT2 family glycosyltransferase
MLSNNSIGAVVIGRNEGERLEVCLESIREQLDYVIYVDSGSTDSSVQLAESLGVYVINLDLTIPFTAARARNEGARALLKINPQIEFIQFVDGDCEVQAGWLDKAYAFLKECGAYAVVCGRRRERYPDASLFNQLCDIEWNTSIGETISCGGDALVRVEALQQVNGYRESLIAGEEPEMCFRLREQGWKIMRLNAEMTLHDAAMTKISQWWKRHKRAGHAFAESYDLHGESAEQFRKADCMRIVFWAAGLPLIIAFLCLLNPVFACLLLVYPFQVIRLTLKYFRQLRRFSPSFFYALSNVASKFPQCGGLFSFYINKFRGKTNTIIEYK